MQYHLAKTDPETYSIDDLERERETIWDGVHNYQAINVIKTWKPGDKVFVYHSMGQAKIVGLMEVTTEPYKDENDPRGISWVAGVKFLKKYPEEKHVSLKEVKASGKFADFALMRQSRLSTMTCPPEFVEWVEQRQSQ